jgi:hypothetical protein
VQNKSGLLFQCDRYREFESALKKASGLVVKCQRST